MKKIIFDLDNTLIGYSRDENWKLTVVPRPGVADLISKLKSLKETTDVQYVLLSSSTKKWVNKGIKSLNAEGVFDIVISADNPLQIKPKTIEEIVFSWNGKFYGQKPFSIIEGDLLLVEDNPLMIQAANYVREKYNEIEMNRIIELCKVTYFEPVDVRRYELVEQLENKSEKTELEKVNLEKMKVHLEKIEMKGLIETEKIYESIIDFVA